ncbi:MAG: hypothetical protein LAT68_13995 [Cyclobacteriaceae bacterium]|nr:hypothetical protein [Cyclobacteriaceae bacterium]MCH8517432.1 hypothetical protein [Cyclobacteriaceae bacterium]
MERDELEAQLKETKRKLDQSVDDLRGVVGDKFEEYKSKSIKIGKTALIVGAAFYFTYKIFGSLFGSKKETVVMEDASSEQLPVKVVSSESKIVTMIKEQIALFLIAIIKQKIAEYLQQLDLLEKSE